jgi:hypothetical protein
VQECVDYSLTLPVLRNSDLSVVAIAAPEADAHSDASTRGISMAAKPHLATNSDMAMAAKPHLATNSDMAMAAKRGPSRILWASALKKTSPGHEFRHADGIQTWPLEDSVGQRAEENLTRHGFPTSRWHRTLASHGFCGPAR